MAGSSLPLSSYGRGVHSARFQLRPRSTALGKKRTRVGRRDISRGRSRRERAFQMSRRCNSMNALFGQQLFLVARPVAGIEFPGTALTRIVYRFSVFVRTHRRKVRTRVDTVFTLKIDVRMPRRNAIFKGASRALKSGSRFEFRACAGRVRSIGAKFVRNLDSMRFDERADLAGGLFRVTPVRHEGPPVSSVPR